MTTLNINQTRREVARRIVKAIGEWIDRPEGRKGTVIVYVDKEGFTDTYSADRPPTDHVSDLIAINEWRFGDRDDSVEDYENTPLSDDEASALIDLFDSRWSIDSAYDFDDNQTRLVYAE